MDRITLGHGSGGRQMHKLIDSLFLKAFSNPILNQKRDSAVLNIGNKKIAFTTDSYVVDPIFFPGGDIGSLAIYGTVNDLSVCGARALYISVGAVIEEGLDGSVLERIVRSMAEAAKKAGVRIVTGDTKVVEKGSCDRIFINTSGIGEVYYEGLSTDKIAPGDSVIVSGPVGDHAISVLSKREGIEFGTIVRSDSAPLDKLIWKVLRSSKKVRFMRDPTRGGLATTLNEIALGAKSGIAIEERDVPVRPPVRQACELLGLDPLYLACEGRVIIIAAKEDGPRILKTLGADKAGRGAKIIGSVTGDRSARVYLNTIAGGKRIIDMLSGEQLPRIC
ncbi:MAG: hydrogenase expression/formation protein HypE [Candidatus Omnitrophica bacterium]|nr:hydrogenase expression/formation protein HypE [Candidatus Omnitrophota bacterium]MBU0895898.1 hydrogenase expression/formation protein HypE [Candidatus Omnitrophota bacterium]MBU1038344.1 hydrogenase expression/formation protein HypE [Candidatus Omnitrophota bacterium]MBU1809471.1 hydrogenase expression/formation protein HypE [Candidatus Omnitrophota bacterium]